MNDPEPLISGRGAPPRPTRVGAPSAEPADRSTDAAELAKRVSEVTKGGVRAAVLGVNDGLVTNVCVILGLAGADASPGSVRLAAFASLIAGALSMAAGEWISVRSQVELYEGLLGELHRLVQRDPQLILDEVADRLEDAGFGRETAQTASTELPLDEPRFLRFASTTIFGIDPQELASPAVAAGSSLVLFAVGGFVPLLPWLIGAGTAATLASVALTAVASIAVGIVVSRSSGRRPVSGALRQLAIVTGSAAVTFAIGTAFGTAVS